MEKDAIADSDDEPTVFHQWSARKMHPVVLVYVGLVFVGFIGLSYFVFHSMTAVKALAMTAVAAIIPLVPSVLHRVEYRLTDRSIDRRPHGIEPPAEFESLVRLDEVNRIAAVSHGFKFFKPLDEPNPVKRFWKTHFSDDFSGEVHVERADRDEVFGVLAGEVGLSV